MKKRVLVSLLAVAALPLWADDDYGYLLFERIDGTQQSVVANGTTITFSGGYAVVESGSTKLNLSLSELSKMFFSSESTGIETVESQGADGSDAAAVYTLNGVRVEKMDRPGVYVVKKNGKTYKQVVR